jgi:hypothetical protein
MAAYRMFPPVGPDKADELAVGDTSVGFGPTCRATGRLIARGKRRAAGGARLKANVRHCHTRCTALGEPARVGGMPHQR